MALKTLYQDIYRTFMENRDEHKGYDFQDSSVESVPPRQVTFKEKLKWWTFNRPSRLKKIAQERDQMQQEILALKHPPQSSR
ncbi:MAG: hypothetical protein NPIRA04_27240 [Nitrospirales bacterium]|nr:MAG: hypothetical protein NPIRA04_27240 [Nitrospirales bacterium]